MRPRDIGGLAGGVLHELTPDEPADHEGGLDELVPSGPRHLRVTGWARDLASTTPVQVEILVAGAVVATATADRPRPDGAANGFEAVILSPSQPARVCARTIAASPFTGVVVACRQRPFPVPIRILGPADEPPPTGQFASFFWTHGDRVVKALGDAPVENGIALYAGEPLADEQLSWAVTVNDPGERAFFRSGPLPELPGPAGSIVATARSITVYRGPGGLIGLRSGEGAPELVTRRLEQLAPAVRVTGVQLDADTAGRELVTVNGRVRRFGLFWLSFVHQLALVVRPESDPALPADVIEATPAEPGRTTGLFGGGSLASVLDRPIAEGVEAALGAGARFIAVVQPQVEGIDLHVTHVSVTALELHPFINNPSVTLRACGGTVSGGIADPPADI